MRAGVEIILEEEEAASMEEFDENCWRRENEPTS